MASNSLASLLRQSTIDDHEELLKAANATLKTSKGDIEAQHVKLVALLKLDRFDEAIQTLETGGNKLKERAQLEHAYALYKTGKPSEAAEIAAKGDERGHRHVEAQARYRSEDFGRAAELYRNLSSNGSEVANEEVDLRINSSAVDAQLEWASLGHLVRNKKPGRQDLEAFETAYNAACGSLARGELAQADILLKRSKDLCNALEDLSEEEKHAEVLPIMVQQVYVLTRLGRAEEAQKLASSIDPNDISDATSKSLARINALASSASDNSFMLQRLLQTTVDIPASDKPFEYQRIGLQKNEAAVALKAQRFDGTAKSTAASITSKPSPALDTIVNSTAVLNAAAHARNQTGKAALKLILPQLEKRPKDIGLMLVIVQLYVLTGNTETATVLLEKFLARLVESTSPKDLDARFAPGLVGTLISLYTIRGQSRHIRAEFSKAAKHWQQRSKDDSSVLTPSLVNFLKTAASALVESTPEDQALAHDIFTNLASSASSDSYITAGLIASTASTNPEKLSADQVSSLTPVANLTAGIDAAALEDAGIARPPATSTKTAASVKRPAEAPAEVKKAKKPKPSKMPKDYDANKTADPERWLPLRDRSTYRPKGRKAKQKAQMFAQGAVEDNAASKPGTPAEKPVQGGGGGKSKGKKKGKGGKW
ncbi:Signal recognition particle subunit SRP72 [Sphaceloma murrayae]|uniref:Signal recognition particle subunit SRP72 n=1 Tax=Sphaceloma murrayae TaxID=2082308 RepID=A0A2K1QQT5_9PEZI|nr:Signal recognition particle subunit SRP72 [Sphaceloma murrayae]